MKCIIRTQQNSHRLFTHVSWKIQLALFVFSMTHAIVRTGCFCSFLVREHYSIWTFCFSSAASQRQWSVVVTGGQEVTRLVSHLWKKRLAWTWRHRWLGTCSVAVPIKEIKNHPEWRMPSQHRADTIAIYIGRRTHARSINHKMFALLKTFQCLFAAALSQSLKKNAV